MPSAFSSLLSVAATLTAVSAISLDFCSKDLLPPSEISNSLQFTKELSPWEFAVDSEFKSLHCCAKGYLSIEWIAIKKYLQRFDEQLTWNTLIQSTTYFNTNGIILMTDLWTTLMAFEFKDGRPYPWPSDVSSFILYPEAANQTVYTKVLTATDAGNYTCRLHNDTSYTNHTMELKVFDSTGYMEHPLATYRPSNTSYADVGQSTRLFCEAFVGRIDLPDASNEVKWVKDGVSLSPSPHVTIALTTRDKGQIVGAYLTIQDIEDSDFGTYTCSISNTGDQKIVMSTQLKAFGPSLSQLCLYDKALVLLFVVATLVFLCALAYLKKLHSNENSTVRLFVKKLAEMPQSYKWKPSTGGVIILYGDGDDYFMEEVFLPSLRRHSHFSPLPIKITKEWGLTEDNKELCKRVERVIIILSKQLVTSWTRERINESLQNFMMKEAQYCIILMEALPYMVDEEPQFFYGQRSKFTLFPWNEESFTGDALFGNRSESHRDVASNSRLNSQRFSLKRFFPVTRSSAEEPV